MPGFCLKGFTVIVRCRSLGLYDIGVVSWMAGKNPMPLSPHGSASKILHVDKVVPTQGASADFTNTVLAEYFLLQPYTTSPLEDSAATAPTAKLSWKELGGDKPLNSASGIAEEAGCKGGSFLKLFSHHHILKKTQVVF